MFATGALVLDGAAAARRYAGISDEPQVTGGIAPTGIDDINATGADNLCVW